MTGSVKEDAGTEDPEKTDYPDECAAGDEVKVEEGPEIPSPGFREGTGAAGGRTPGNYASDRG